MFFSRFVRFIAQVALVLASVCISAHAADSFVIKDIRLEGLQRVEPGTVFSYLPVQVGDTFTEEKGADAIRALYETGFFRDVQIQAQGDVLIVIVEERPTISRIEFTGMKEFDQEIVRKSLKSVGVAEARFYDKALIDKAEQELKRQYVSKGMYAAEVVATVTPVERNQVAIYFNIDEGPVAKIQEINFIGNKVFSESTLTGMMQLQVGGWLSWYTKDNLYSKQKLTADLETIRSYYLNRGYLEFVIDSTQVSITPDKKSIYLTISIKEGQKFTVQKVSLAGELLGKEAELMQLVQLKAGDTFSSAKLTESTKAIADLLGSYGYAFATINPQPDIHREQSEVDLTLVVDPGRRVYVRKVNISGNAKTRDVVIRREMRQFESSWFDGDKIELSKKRLGRLGYFTENNVTTQDVPGSPDQVDVNVDVKEKPTGSVSLGAGYSSTEKVILTAGVNQDNAFGTGQSIGLNGALGKVNQSLTLSNYDPYFTEDGISRYSDLFYRTSKPLYYIGDPDYQIKSLGTNIKFGVPYSEVDRVFFGTGFEAYQINTTINTPQPYLNYAQSYGIAAPGYPGTLTTYNVPLTAGWARDGRDSALIPSEGSLQQLSSEVGTPAGNMTYYRVYGQYQKYHSFSKANILSFNGEVGYGQAYGAYPFPITKNYYVGGIGSVRGYAPGSLGPTYYNTTYGTYQPTGGQSKIVTNVEYTVPVPGSGTEKTLRMFTFVDGGNAFGQNINLVLRYSYGLGISWISPLGPLKFSYGIPIKSQPTDNIQRLQFQVGTAF
ncbi:outer membrane protein assembly factor BamA [Polynucleobacter paneuropaeus]|uniref:Outer membrane protein assembly factor BamA n=1 Tax=Polynucleobacter paneuropaeus TaxID=2527775 RepID=A0A2Z4JVF8_9BURK|nr:outer membrane protein assembly factor BamA [Polynucleobacter paneuropaeus]MBT8523861.1 outer membrane protein assembly factor BamA [Polynucleobacter paneuropaeus]QWD35356.1 outer membrane protein assembly factor BamA [Polynucleobacter paneuropaeus]